MPLTNMGLILPTLGADRGAWDDKINACLTLIDAHDHTAGKGARITTAAISIDADLSMNGYALTGISQLSLVTSVAPSSGALLLFVNVSDNELYWTNASGNNVKLTSGTSINATLAGGIAGDYISVGAEVAFDDANDRYTFKQQGSPKPWAKMASADVRIYPAGSGSLYTGLKAAAIASSFDITLPLALPSTTNPLMLSSAGIITAPTDLTLTSNANVILSGSGYIKRGNQTRVVLLQAALFNQAAGVVTTTAGTAGANIPISATVYYPLDGNINNEVLQGVGVTVNSVAGGSPTYSLVTANTSGTFAAITGASVTTASTGVVITPTTPAVPPGPLWLKIVTDGSTTVKITEADVITSVA